MPSFEETNKEMNSALEILLKLKDSIKRDMSFYGYYISRKEDERLVEKIEIIEKIFNL